MRASRRCSHYLAFVTLAVTMIASPTNAALTRGEFRQTDPAAITVLMIYTGPPRRLTFPVLDGNRSVVTPDEVEAFATRCFDELARGRDVLTLEEAIAKHARRPSHIQATRRAIGFVSVHRQADMNHDGRISLQEMRQQVVRQIPTELRDRWLRAAFGQNTGLGRTTFASHVRQVFEAQLPHVDANGDGVVSGKEFAMLIPIPCAFYETLRPPSKQPESVQSP